MFKAFNPNLTVNTKFLKIDDYNYEKIEGQVPNNADVYYGLFVDARDLKTSVGWVYWIPGRGRFVGTLVDVSMKYKKFNVSQQFFDFPDNMTIIVSFRGKIDWMTSF